MDNVSCDLVRTACDPRQRSSSSLRALLRSNRFGSTPRDVEGVLSPICIEHKRIGALQLVFWCGFYSTISIQFVLAIENDRRCRESRACFECVGSYLFILGSMFDPLVRSTQMRIEPADSPNAPKFWVSKIWPRCPFFYK